jgi:hypothetical protein
VIDSARPPVASCRGQERSREHQGSVQSASPGLNPPASYRSPHSARPSPTVSFSVIHQYSARCASHLERKGVEVVSVHACQQLLGLLGREGDR